MANERWGRAKRLVAAALALDTEEQAAFLNGLGDSDLREQVESLLAAKDDTGQDADSVTVDKSTAIKPLSPDTNAPERIGPYRILRQVGEGGMGIVYEAAQEKPVRRKVALKLVKWGMDTKAVIARFETERQALALMNHPNISSVFDAGATEAGRPYFAMEYVQGIPITEYCDKHRLTIEQRLRLFIQVCEGVQHAHQKGIIHRDIKPSNVLVALQDDKPVPKIIDFGVAKATSQRLTEHTIATELGQLVGTPEYMSPEQAEMTNLDIDTRTDVYSLGVLLYELLVGAQPFDFQKLRKEGLSDFQRRLREDEPPRPSTKVGSLGEDSTSSASNRRVELRVLERQLRGDLDWITVKAIEKDRTRRYETANAFALDIQRFLDNEPIRARAPTTRYRFERFVRRHRLGVAFGAGLVVLLLAFAVAMAAQADRIARERDRANREALAATEVSQYLTNLFRVADPSRARGNTITAREILDKGARDIDQSLADQPEVKARLLSTIGEVYSNLGLNSEAETFLEQAVLLRTESIGREHLDTLETLQSLANLYWSQDSLDKAEPIYEEVIEARTRLLGEEHPATLKATFDLASLYFVQGRYEEMEALSKQVLAVQRRVLGESHPDTLATLNNLAVLYNSQKRHEEAVGVLDEVLRGEKAELGDDHPSVLNTAHNLASVLSRMDQLDRAELLLTEVIDARARVLGPDHQRTVTSKLQLAILYTKAERFQEAEPLFDAVVAQRLKDLGEQHRSTLTAFNARARLFADQGRYERAEEELLAVYRVTSSPNSEHPLNVTVVDRLVDLYEAWDKPEKAAEYRALLEAGKAKP